MVTVWVHFGPAPGTAIATAALVSERKREAQPPAKRGVEMFRQDREGGFSGDGSEPGRCVRSRL